MNTSFISELNHSPSLSGEGKGPANNPIARLSDPIIIEKGKGELPNAIYEPLNVHPNPYLQGITEVSSTGPQNPLPSRDIPKNTLQYAQDEATLPNYIPPPSNGRRVHFVDEFNDGHVEQFRRKKYRKHILDDVWEQLHMPLLVSLLFFVLSMPFFDQLFHGIFFKWLPILFEESTGQINLYGRLLKACMFGGAYTGVMSLIQFG